MFFTKLLNKIPFFRKRKVKKIKRDLALIKDDFADGFFNDEYIISLHNILESSLIDFSDVLVANSTQRVELYTNTSLNAIKILEMGVTKKSNLERSPLITMIKEDDYFTNWYSNEESVLNFMGLMTSYTQAHVWTIELTNSPDFVKQEVVDKFISSLNPEILDSLLYRFLLEDLVTILIFYLENNYE